MTETNDTTAAKSDLDAEAHEVVQDLDIVNRLTDAAAAFVARFRVERNGRHGEDVATQLESVLFSSTILAGFLDVRQFKWFRAHFAKLVKESRAAAANGKNGHE